MTPGAHEPLRVDFFLSSPLCLGQFGYIRLDGILSHLRCRHIAPEAYRVRSKSGEAEPMPLAGMKVMHHRVVWHASVGLLDADEPPNPYEPLQRVSEDDRSIYKRLETHLLCDPRLASMASWTHTAGTGLYKSTIIKLTTHPVRRVRFYVRANKPMLEELLAGLVGLGKKTAIGYGRISSWKITEMDEDRSVTWRGRAMRTLPVEMLSSWDILEKSGWRPPYWNGRDLRMCAPPGARVTLKSAAELRRLGHAPQFG